MQLGYIVAQVYTSDAEIPIVNAVFSVTGTKDNVDYLYGIRTTDENGKTELIPIETPDRELSLEPNNIKPYTTVNVRIDHPDYITKIITGVQIFAGEVSVQKAPMLPTNKFNANIEKYDITSQEL